jgi:hypothetical protein
MQTQKQHDDALAWLDQLDAGLLGLERVTRSNFIAADDRRTRCDAWTGEPEFGRLCGNITRDGARYCGSHIRHRRPVQTFGPENPDEG